MNVRVKYSWTWRWDVARLGLVASLLVGCATGSTTAGSALVHANLPYAVTYDDERAKSVMGEDWTLETYRVASKSADGASELERKDGYTTDYDFDFDDDDKGDSTETLPYPDLLFVNKKTDARLEVTTVLLDKRLAKKKLKVLLGNIVESSSGTRSLFVAAGKSAAVGVEKRFAMRIVDTSEATLGSQKGLVATLESSDLDQVELDSKAVASRSRLFLVHAPFDYLVSEGVNLLTSDATKEAKPKVHRYRVLLVVEYRNTPEDFEASYPDFLRLLGKIHLLTDDMMIELLAEPLSKCRMSKTAKLKLDVSATGKVSISERSGFEEYCVGFVESYRFAGTGEARQIEHAYDFDKPLKPAWLTVNGYVEQRAAAEPTPIPAAPADPSATPPTSEPPSEAPPAATAPQG